MAPRPPIQAMVLDDQSELDTGRRYWRMALFNEDGTPFAASEGSGSSEIFTVDSGWRGLTWPITGSRLEEREGLLAWQGDTLLTVSTIGGMFGNIVSREPSEEFPNIIEPLDDVPALQLLGPLGLGEYLLSNDDDALYWDGSQIPVLGPSGVLFMQGAWEDELPYIAGSVVDFDGGKWVAVEAVEGPGPNPEPGAEGNTAWQSLGGSGGGGVPQIIAPDDAHVEFTAEDWGGGAYYVGLTAAAADGQASFTVMATPDDLRIFGIAQNNQAQPPLHISTHTGASLMRLASDGTLRIPYIEFRDAALTLSPAGEAGALAYGSEILADRDWVTAQLGAKLDLTMFNAKGDLIVASANDTGARLAVGSNGQVLTADSAEATGLKWAAAPPPAFRGAWSGGAAYSVNDLSYFLGSIYRATNTIGAPAVTFLPWDTFNPTYTYTPTEAVGNGDVVSFAAPVPTVGTIYAYHPLRKWWQFTVTVAGTIQVSYNAAATTGGSTRYLRVRRRTSSTNASVQSGGDISGASALNGVMSVAVTPGTYYLTVEGDFSGGGGTMTFNQGTATVGGNTVPSSDTTNWTRVYAPAEPEAWQTPTLLNTWTAYDSSTLTQAPRFRKNGDEVLVQGLVKHGSNPTNSVILTLPTGYRPTNHQRFTVPAASGVANIQVEPDGDVTLVAYAASGTAGYVDLAAIRFPVP